MANLPPADWYPDPGGSGQLRYFDGKDWTDFYQHPRREWPATSESHTRRGRLTAEDVANVAFSRPPTGRRGYNEEQVDAFLGRVEQRLRDPRAKGGLTADQVHKMVFSKPALGKRGYNEGEVDAFLDRVEETLRGVDADGHRSTTRW